MEALVTCPCLQRWHCPYHVRGLYLVACRLLGMVALSVGDGKSSTLRWEGWCQQLGRLMGSWLSGRDSMHPLSWPCSVGMRNSFPSLCRMPVFLLPLRVKSQASAREELRPHCERGLLLRSLHSPRAGLYLPGVVSPMIDLKAPQSFICHWL